jgi:hypothetical protein
VSELYRASGRRLSAKLVPNFADRGVYYYYYYFFYILSWKREYVWLLKSVAVEFFQMRWHDQIVMHRISNPRTRYLIQIANCNK